jgi:hypothetical protein
MTSFLIFLTLLFDACVIPILVRANFREIGITFFDGRNTDFGPYWYPDLGYQMLINLAILSV